MKKSLAILGLVALATGATACSFAVRDASTYAADTATVLAARDAPIKACYDEVLRTDGQAAGTVAVRFTVEKKTGTFLEAALVPERTTAPAPLAQCVLNQLGGLVLQPPDQNQGDATFVWEFTANEPITLSSEATPAEAVPVDATAPTG